jgi:hypothetical protein
MTFAKLLPRPIAGIISTSSQSDEYQYPMIFIRIAHSFWNAARGHPGELVAALAGAVAGSFTAYWLQRGTEKRRERNENRAAIVRAQVALIAQLNTLQILWQQYFLPVLNDSERETKIGMIWFVQCDPLVDVGTLSFLVTRKTPNIPFDVHLAQRSFISAMDALRERNSQYEQIFQRGETHAINPNTGQSLIRADPRAILNYRAATDAIYNLFPAAIARSEAMTTELKRIGVKRYTNWFSRRYGTSGFLSVKCPPIPK